jgi:hypothetical protein
MLECRFILLAAFLLTFACLQACNNSNAFQAAELKSEEVSFSKGDWPWWRGPTRDGIAEPGQQPPLEWSETKNVI